MKICKKCSNEKDNDEFYKGHAICKLCYIEKVKEHRKNNYEHYIEYDKKRANLPKRVEARKAYTKTENGKIAALKGTKKWNETNVIKRSANIIVGNAVQNGKIIKPKECSVCGKEGIIHGHHDDYAYPLLVRWLCSQCHCDWHKNNNPLNG